MSYKSVVLADQPLAYYPLDDMTAIDSLLNFTDLLAQFATYQEILDTFSSYSNVSGDVVYDYSGCNNNGYYAGDPDPYILPIVVGNSRSTKITNSNSVTYNISKDYAGLEYADHFGTKYSSDADFTLECWFYPNISSSSTIPLFADISNNIGIFYDKGNIKFGLDTENLSCTLSDTDTVFHIVAVYSVGSAYIYVNGNLEASLSLNNFEFTNLECNLQSGPTPANNHFLINSLAVYRYSLPYNKIVSHYNYAKGLPPNQIVYPQDGELFSIYDNCPTLVYKYSYPGNKNWDFFTDSQLVYNQNDNSMSLAYTRSTACLFVAKNDDQQK